MGRRSDHTPQQLRALLVKHGHALVAETGMTGFSGRAVAKRAGYSVGTIYNVFGSLGGLIAAINTHTFQLWAAHLREGLHARGDDRICALVESYFSFALEHPNLWSAIYEHRLAPDEALSQSDLEQRAGLTNLVEGEVRAALPQDTATDVARFSRSLIATVHGHCSFAVSGSFALLDESDPVRSALDRVRESLAAHR